MRDEGWLLYRNEEKSVYTIKLDGKVAVKESDVRCCSDGLELSCDNGQKVRVAFALNCTDREIMSWVATTNGVDAALVGNFMLQAVENRFGQHGKTPRSFMAHGQRELLHGGRDLELCQTTGAQAGHHACVLPAKQRYGR